MTFISSVSNDHWGGADSLQPAFSSNQGPPGMVVTISGSGFTGATAVRFGGVPAAFTVHSDSDIEATVPTVSMSATKVTVVAPTGSAQHVYTVLFFGPLEQPPDESVAGSPAGNYTDSTSTYRIAKLANWGDTPDMFSGAYHPDSGGQNFLYTGDEVRGIGYVPYGGASGQSTWFRELSIAVLNILEFMHTVPTDAEMADPNYRGYLIDSPDPAGGAVLTDIELDYELSINGLGYLDGSVKPVAAADNMTGNLQVRRPPPADYESVPHKQLVPDTWPDPATLAGWPLLIDVPIDTGMDFYVDNPGVPNSLYMSKAPLGGDLAGNDITGTLVFAVTDLDTSPAGAFAITDHAHSQLPLVFALSRFADGTSLAPIDTPPGEKAQEIAGGTSGPTVDGSWDSGFFADARFRITEVRFTYRPLMIRLLSLHPPVMDFSASLTAQVRPVAAHRAQLHEPAAFSVPAPGAEVYAPEIVVVPNDNYADARLIVGASGVVTFDITGYTIEPSELFVADHSAWFTWVAPATGTATFDTAATPAPRWDSLLTAYSDGVGLPVSGRMLATEDDNDLQPGITTPDTFGTSSVSFACVAGDRYYLQVSSYDYPADAMAGNPSAGYPRADAKLRWSVA